MLGQETAVLLLLCVGLLLLMAAVTNGAGFSLDGIKGRTVGDGQHGTARFAGKGEIRRTFHRVRFRPRAWRRGKHLPKVQGLVVGCEMRGKRVTALVDSDDIHAMMVAGSGAGKTAYFLYPNLEYCCAAGMSFLTSDTKGDLARNYAGIAKDIYGYDVSVLDLRNPACSDGNNLLDLVNKYMDAYMAHPDDLASRARAVSYTHLDVYKRQGYISPQCGLNGIRAAHQNGVLAEYRAPVGRKSPNFARCKAILRRTRSIYEGGIDGENTKIYGPYAAGPV